MAGFTNKGKAHALASTFQNVWSPTTTYYIALCTSAVAPVADTNTLSQLTEIAAGNGYTAGGKVVARNATDFDTLDENDTGDFGSLMIIDQVWTASGGTIPSSGDGARYAVLLDDHATPSAREVFAYWDLTSDRSVSSGQTLTLADCDLRLTET
jgi:hypothetical protein